VKIINWFKFYFISSYN